MANVVEIHVTDRDGRERVQKVLTECYGCGYFHPEPEDDDPYYKCHYPDNEPAGWAPCDQEEPTSNYDN